MAPRFEPELHVRRAEDGSALGALLVTDDEGHAVAQPTGWLALAEAEERFLEAERARLLYVAATRAKRTLVVSQYGGPGTPGDVEAFDESGWKPLAAALAEVPALEVELTEPEGRRKLSVRPEAIEAAVRDADGWREAAGAPGWRRNTVTRAARAAALEQRTGEVDTPSAGSGGLEWGSAVHRVLEAAGRGRRGEALLRFLRAVAADSGLSEDDAARLEAVVTGFLAREGSRLEGGRVCLEYPLMRVEDTDAGRILREGVADAVILEADRARVLDWKTGGPGVTEAEAYKKQVDAYARIIEAESGLTATGEIVPVTGGG